MIYTGDNESDKMRSTGDVVVSSTSVEAGLLGNDTQSANWRIFNVTTLDNKRLFCLYLSLLRIRGLTNERLSDYCLLLQRF